MDNLKNIIEKLKIKRNVFLTGGAGVGKTTITKNIIKHYEEEAKKVAKLASTGMAATLIGGQTLHSFLDLGIASDLSELESSGKLEISKKVKKLISGMDLIVIDEISMVSQTLLEMITLRLTQAGFRGSLLVVGDFLQLPPVVRRYKEVRFAFESSAWREFEFDTIELTHIYRTNDKDFIELLANIRDGFVDERIHNNLNEFIKPLPENLSEFTFLFGKNDSASRHNKNQLAHVEKELHVKEAQIIKHVKSAKDIEIERFMEDARVEKELELKVGARVLFTRNSWNYFNGERGVVLNIDNSFVHVQKSDGLIVKLEPLAQSKNAWKEKSVDGKKEMVEEALFSVYQYPIKLSYAITIHKSQGMSIEDLIIETNEIFAPSQFYVAISRSLNPKRLTLIAPRCQWREIVFVNQKALEFTKSRSNSHIK
ncbi:MAG: ATPase [Sulfurimonas sp. RIFOXYD12_FULL_33_39]|uniref:ATP-dependent DNA helicase n=1 Tax=unclassified Sulfurimonas TaxID=2623549 RepID=UPI0008C8F319|nr:MULTISPECIES: AAA family ATPase [unclassified Sulfurimonas]OHE06561.1 MAG: ATPase [Sulfurimonas sp. RIFCSPLOWO2_12_FULL_34_6]OHE09658.1 MAG: ATPase [Sulfurimonas sp. RIFOXYD12_FULL_33_39]OHE13834.1 MAG: ATPase [Sulfurimonas sp. RIFOXYD2_FULL_34_21]DAB27690.1 MAG TPA: ATPase [Sulfurimonas sp. UBA10385]